MKSIYPKLALCGSKNVWARTDTVFFPISEVSDGTVSLVLCRFSVGGDLGSLHTDLVCYRCVIWCCLVLPVVTCCYLVCYLLCYRGLLTTLLLTPYEAREAWAVTVARYCTIHSSVAMYCIRIRTRGGIYGQIYPFGFKSSLGLRPRELLQPKGYI